MLENFLKRFGYVKGTAQQQIKRRSFAGSNVGNLYSAWTTTNQSQDAELRNNLKTLRARSRELERNNDYAKKFIRMVKTNVIGPNGIIMQARVKNDNGQPDKVANAKIEDAWWNWADKGNCDVTGKYSFRDIQNLAMTSMARDGEILIRKLSGYQSNPFRFALQLIEADHLDENYNTNLNDGNKIKMGVEIDSYGRPLAYHLFNNHPGDSSFGQSYGERTRVPANEIIHLFVPQRLSQNRGIPWMHSAMTRLNMVGGYEEAELVAARIAAAKGGFYTSGTGDDYVADDTDEGTPIQEVEPGHFELLPKGLDFKQFNPEHPTTAFDMFIKAVLRGVASGLDVSYNYLANDLTSVNYSSIRAGILDERDVWKELQAFMIEHFMQEIFREWLRMALLTQMVELPISKIEKFNSVQWQPRGWQWVDPASDVEANTNAVNNLQKTRSEIAAERGKDFEEDILAQLAIEQKLIEQYGLKVIDKNIEYELKPKSPKQEGKQNEAGN